MSQIQKNICVKLLFYLFVLWCLCLCLCLRCLQPNIVQSHGPFFTFRFLFLRKLEIQYFNRDGKKRSTFNVWITYFYMFIETKLTESRRKRKRKENQNNILLSVRFGIEWNIYYLLMYIGNWSWNCMCQWSFQRFPISAECRYINTINLSHKSTMDLLSFFGMSTIIHAIW